MTAPRDEREPPVVLVDPTDARATAGAFFDAMPWDGVRAMDPSRWPAARFFELVCGDPERGA